ncbi:glycoside hydrolase family 5 protein [Coniophora puteana RWD-64-598 SS2]|uniref:Glycoside hydrolase family 5 protein n=1 Tax=Coniophora puteana (strain RWD-64-598) TaxID=741705 RepID=A0A5M3M8W6_CONPW|nr:glycoside hydrolase family 5 protein [Coniophora puteana RWD-64-598 SS2]EIW75230.1 glycoside hydrolase family 5 protein [Coniophora puteana RWD-64-598 SS2]
MRLLFASVWLASLLTSVLAGMPDKIYGVNLGSWLVLESWMLPQGWLDMGGQSCQNCQDCIATEHAFAKAYPETVDEKFAQHWETWFTQDHVSELKAAGINTVRIPLGYWIIEALVDPSHEAYPKGGLKYLRQGLGWLKDAGISVILDHHALPGVQSANQQFTGNCTDTPQFYTPYNYHRALVWTSVMTALTHMDPNFGSVFSIEAVNEPTMNATQTPGYGDFQKNFVQVVRTIELIIGIPGIDLNLGLNPDADILGLGLGTNFTAALGSVADAAAAALNPEVQLALADAVPIILEIATECGLESIFTLLDFMDTKRDPIVTSFMDVNWQYNNPSNPADAKIGPQGYDNHLYYSFGGVADSNPEAYLISICNLNRIQNDAKLGNTPLWFGEWGLPTQFNATDAFLYKWADAQKYAYSQGAGWIFWNFKTEISALTNGTSLARQWSYLEALKMGFLTQNPAQLNDADVCKPYIGKTYTSTTMNAVLTSAASTSTGPAAPAATTAVTATAADKTTGSESSGAPQNTGSAPTETSANGTLPTGTPLTKAPKMRKALQAHRHSGGHYF